MKALEDLPRGLANAIALEDDAEALLEEPGIATTGDKIYRIANSQLEAALVEAGKDGAPQVIGEFMYPYIEGWATQAGSEGAGPKLTGMLLEMPSAELLHLTEAHVESGAHFVCATARVERRGNALHWTSLT